VIDKLSREYTSLLIVSAILLLSGCTEPRAPLEHRIPSACTIYDMKQARCIDEGELVKRLASYRVVFIGDAHGQKDLHKRIAKLIGRLGRGGRKISLANEWFTPADDTLLQRYAEGSFRGNLDKAAGWKEKAGYDFGSYETIYHTVRKIGGGLYGVNLSNQYRKQISDADISAMTKSEKDFYDSLDLGLSAHEEMLAPFFSHCHALRKGEKIAECRERMYRVQVAWDSYMAKESAALAKRLLHHRADRW